MKGSQFIHMFIYSKQTTFDHKKNHKNDLTSLSRRNIKQCSLTHPRNFISPMMLFFIHFQKSKYESQFKNCTLVKTLSNKNLIEHVILSTNV
jgi:hypothetical protein